MFRLIRNTHLALGLALFLATLLFAFSAVVFMYRPLFPGRPVVRHDTLAVSPGTDPAAAALHLMRSRGLRGDVSIADAGGDTVTIRVVRPGTEVRAAYVPTAGTLTVVNRRYSVFEKLLQVHGTRGFWHDYGPANLWAAVSLLVSVTLVLLGATGIYLWFRHSEERRPGVVLIALGVIVPVAALILTRLTTG
jgi:hypothetical protein